jgi:cyclopropane fatty-acyl-phospholipid synthase-like methyltransferase
MAKKQSSKPHPNPRHKATMADRHHLYQQAVQCVEAEIDFVDATFKKIRKRRAAHLREDFCGTAATACEWVRRRPTNFAVGLDLDQPTLDWGMTHNVAKLKPAARDRIKLLNRNVNDPGREACGVDMVLAMNFSYWIFQTRPELRHYFEKVRESLVKDGIFFLDTYGGWESTKIQRERRQIGGKKRGFTYIWDQATFDPITNHGTNYIHFRLADGTHLRKAFTYDWRVWSIPEIRELLEEAGFSRVTVYWEGEDENGEGDGIFTPAQHGEACPVFISYIVAER